MPHPYTQPPEYLMPLNSGLVTAEVGALISRQPLKETEAHFIEAGVRLANAYIMGDGDLEDKLDPFDILPNLKLEEVCHQATEIALAARARENPRLVRQTRVRPYTPGAFYKAFSLPRGQGSSKKGVVSNDYRLRVAQVLVENAAWPPQDAADRGLHIPTEFRVRAGNPGYIFAGFLALHSANPALGFLTSGVRKAIHQETVRMTHLVEHELDRQQRELQRGITAEHMGIALTGQLRGAVISHRRQLAGVTDDQERAARSALHITTTELAANGILQSFSRPKSLQNAATQ